MLDIHTLQWDDELLRILGVPRRMLPEVRPSSEVYGTTVPDLLGAAVPIAAAAGDQQAAAFGQACFEPGSAKNTYGTGCFALLNTGETPVASGHGLLTTIAWRIAGRTSYALEGSVFIAGAAVQWLRDGLQIVGSAAETAAIAATVPDAEGVVFVPALTGLGSPYWEPDVRGLITGLTRGTTGAHLVRATLEAIAFQVADVLDAFPGELAALRADGGASANRFLMQLQADLLGRPVEIAADAEATALGAAALAGLGVGTWDGLDDVRRLIRHDEIYEPGLSRDEAAARREEWARAVERARL
jgi:glycerol kinase